MAWHTGRMFTGRGKHKYYTARNLSYYHSVNCSGIEPGLPQIKADNISQNFACESYIGMCKNYTFALRED
jgi:hypothetical protein